MNVAFQRNIGSFITVVAAMAATNVVAGSGDDGAAQEGIAFDRTTKEPLCLSALASVQVSATLAAAETVEVNIGVQDSADGITWDDYEPGPLDNYTPTVLTETGDTVATRKIQLGGARRYVRILPTLTFSAGGADEADISGVLVVGGADELPIADQEAAPAS